MRSKIRHRAFGFVVLGFLSATFLGCTASSQGLSSRIDGPARTSTTSKSQASLATSPTLKLEISVDAAYAAIPHRRTVMDFAASNMPEADKRFLEVAFHVIDEAIRLRVTALQRFAHGDRDSRLVDDMDTLFDYLQNVEAPSVLSSYQRQLLKALSDQRAFFQEWQIQGEQFQYAQSIGAHPKVQSASAALRAAYGMLMEQYANETSGNKEAFFDYHCALDFI